MSALITIQDRNRAKAERLARARVELSASAEYRALDATCQRLAAKAPRRTKRRLSKADLYETEIMSAEYDLRGLLEYYGSLKALVSAARELIEE